MNDIWTYWRNRYNFIQARVNSSFFKNDEKEAEVDRLKRAIHELEIENQRLKGIKMESEWGVALSTPRCIRNGGLRFLCPSFNKSTHILPETLTVSSVLQKLTFSLLETIYCTVCSFFWISRIALLRKAFFLFLSTKKFMYLREPISRDSISN